MNSSSCSGAERRRAVLRAAAVALPVALLLAGCGGDDAPQAASGQSAQPVVVEADVFSGRANPTWSMTADEANEFRTLLDALPTTATCPSAPRDGLGFRGFGVAGLTVHGQVTRRIGIDADCVRVEAADGTHTQLRDQDRSAQEFLIKFASDRDPSMRTILASS